MITQKLFCEVLIKPVLSRGANRLLAVSGYATANMVYKHLEKLNKYRLNAELNIIVGMSKKDGIEKAQHVAFQKFSKQGPYGNTVNFRYINCGNPVHAKTYLWLKDEELIIAFSGSANYTNTGFGETQTEAMSEVNPDKAYKFYTSCFQNSISCTESGVDTRIAIVERSFNNNLQRKPEGEHISLSLLQKDGTIHDRAGLNWGQRKNRNPDQAYIPVPANVQKTDFFPKVGEKFTVLTDDNRPFIFVRAQEKGKALETTEDNSQLGEYLRSRIGVKSGEYVTHQHLQKYGRTDITFIKIDHETYLMDFRSNSRQNENSESLQD